MNNTPSFEVRSDLNNFSMHTATGNIKVLSDSFEFYDERMESEHFESASFNTTNFMHPSEHLADKIIQQVEFLFSDVNILKDKFLMKHIKRNKEGYVSLKLISSLRKVKALTKDWRVVALSLQKSQVLQMNDEMTKVKRKHPLPEYKMIDGSRTVLVFHYSPSGWSLERQLKALGSVVFLEIVNSQADMWYASVQKTLSFYEKIATLPFAVVMFGTPHQAANAVLRTSHPASVILKIVPLLETECLAPPDFDDKITQFGCKPVENEFCSAMPNFFPSILAQQCVLRYNGKNQSHGDMHSQSMIEKSFLACSYKGDGPVNNTGYQKKSCLRNHKQTRVLILRQPKGPDGTKGFWKGRIQKFPENVCAIY